MNTQNNYFIIFIYYTITTIFHVVLFLTDIGNFFHRGTPFELIVLQITAIIIVLIAFRLIGNTKFLNKIFIIIFTLIPAIFVLFSIISIIRLVVPE